MPHVGIGERISGSVSSTVAEPAPRIAQRAAIGRWLHDHLLAVTVGLCASGPVMAATLRALIDGWMPAGDQANIAVRAFDVFTSRTPLVGQHSDAGALTHQAVYSLGPMLFWLLALPARLASPGALTLTTGLVNVVAIVGVIVLARRRGGRALMFITAVAVVLMSRSLAPEALHDVWNPSAGLFPFTLVIFLCWSLACGEYRLLPLTVLVSSFAVQCQLAFLLPTLGALAVGIAGLAVALRSPTATRRPRSRDVRRWVLAAVLVVAVCWALPVFDEFQGNPGNLTAIERTVTANRSTLGATVGWHAVVLAVGVRPWWTTNSASPWERKNEVRAAPSAVAVVSTVLVLAALVVVVGVGLVRRRVDLWAGALIAIALSGALAAIAAATPTTRLLSATLGYTMWLGSPIGMFVWVMLLWAPIAIVARRTWLPRRLAPVVASAAGVGAVALAGVGIAAAQPPDEHLAEYRPLGIVFASLERRIPTGRTVQLLGYLGNETFRFKMAARFAMVRHGIRPLSPGTDARLGSWYELDHHRYDCTVYVKDGRAAPTPSAALVASVTYNRSYPISVWMSPRGCPASGSTRPIAR
jgi:hypothetical protein